MIGVRKKYIAAVAFSLLIVTPLLLIAGLQCWQTILKHQWKERLEQQAAQTITVPIVTIVWEKQDRELVIDGRMFDIFSYYVKGNSLVATGVFDEEETRLETFLTIQNSHSPQTVSVVQLLFVIQCFAALLKWVFTATNGGCITATFPTFSNTHTNPFFSIITPPPRFPFYTRS